MTLEPIRITPATPPIALYERTPPGPEKFPIFATFPSNSPSKTYEYYPGRAILAFVSKIPSPGESEHHESKAEPRRTGQEPPPSPLEGESHRC
jgi:hypothetical protein